MNVDLSKLQMGAGIFTGVLAASLALMGHSPLTSQAVAASGFAGSGLAVICERQERRRHGQVNAWMLEQIAMIESNAQTQLEQQISALKQSHCKELKKAVDEVEDARRKHRFAEYDRDVLRGELQEALDAKSALECRYSYLNSLEANLASQKAALAETSHKTQAYLDEFEVMIQDQVRAQYAPIIENMQAETDGLRLELLKYIEPIQPQTNDIADAYSSRIIDFLWHAGITLDHVKAWFDTKERLIVWLKPRPHNAPSLKDLEKQTEYLAREYEAESVIVGNNGGCIEFVIDFRSTSKSTTNPSLIIPAPANWLETLVLPEGNPQHIRVVGESESGKSALVSNIIGIFQSQYPDIQVKLLDPLGDSGDSEWDIPRTAANAEECHQKLQDYAAKMDDGKMSQPTILIQDEIDSMIADHAKSVTDPLRKILKQGRHKNLWLIIIGQSPNVGGTSMALADWNNSQQIFIGTTIEKALSTYIHDSKTSSLMRSQVEARYHSDDHKYYAAVVPKPKHGKAFIADLPKPGTYSDVPSEFPEAPQTLIKQGMSTADIILKLYGMKPSRSEEYQNRKAEINALR